jgi:membrane protein
VLGLGFLLLVSLIASALLNLLNQKLLLRYPDFDPDYFHAANTLIIIAIISLLFAVIYKILPDAVISWKDAWIGSLFTAVLFLFGKFVIGYYLGKANLGIAYGTAASVVIILTWVYYSAVILYFGAEFTKIYALHSGEGIRPKPTAVFIIKKESKEVPASYLDT